MWLIDADALWCDIQMLPHNGDMISGEEVEQAIADAPTIDAVPVVRCGECKHTREKTEYEAVYLKPECLICEHPEVSEDGWAVVSPKHFCSYGEPKEDN